MSPDGPWREYADLGNDSGISHYRTGDGHIDVRFKRGGEYRYRARDLMPGAIEAMRWLAEAGDDLNRYLNENCRGAGRRIHGSATGPDGGVPLATDEHVRRSRRTRRSDGGAADVVAARDAAFDPVRSGL